MKYSTSSIAAAMASVLTLSQSANAQQPPDVVKSDAYDNTAMGTNALTSVQPGGANSLTGTLNTAAGYSALTSLTTGYGNDAFGVSALASTTTGNENVAFGGGALSSNVNGSQNTAIGHSALQNTTAGNNTAVGYLALAFGTTGDQNTVVGSGAMQNTTGNDNTAIGSLTLYTNTTGYANTASGYEVLYANTTGYYNTGSGYYALHSNTSGFENAANGYQALYSNTTGQKNFGDGVNALYSNTTGNLNTAFGSGALYSNTSGSYNLGAGYHAGENLTTGSNNIDIGNVGVAAESGIIRIGTSGTQTAAYISGIQSSQVTGAAVYVTSSGQLGVLASSERYKTEIQPMGSSADKLAQLRPVTFHLKSEPKGVVQYGLIAEEVNKVYPELVIRDEAGKIQGVRYDELAPMLLKQVQKQATELNKQQVDMVRYQQENRRHEASMQAQLSLVTKQYEAMQSAMLKMQSGTDRVAMR